MSICVPTPPDKPSIVVIDSKKFRQAGIMQLLGTWADATGSKVSAIASDTAINTDALDATCEIIILSIGSASVGDSEQQALIQSIRTYSPRAALVILSDLEDGVEVRAAFEAGAAAFMPTSTEPTVALQALSFIKCGGTFFPPSALFQGEEGPQASGRAPDGSDPTGNAFHDLRAYSSKLTAKQQQVFRLLRDGPSNKVIARRLGLSEATVKVHIRSILRKLGVENRTQLAIAAMNGSARTMGASQAEKIESETIKSHTVAG